MIGYNGIELMLKQISEAQFVDLFEQTFQNTKYLSKKEVATTHGVADLVLVRPVDKKVAIRTAHKQQYKLTNESYFTVLDCLPDRHKSKKGISFQEIAKRANVSRSYLKQTIIKKLISEGFVVDEENGYFKINGWLPLASKVVAYEAKLYDWKQGLLQANRYRYFADESYLVMPYQTIHRAQVAHFERIGVGLVAFDPDTGRKKTIVKSNLDKRSLDLPRRYTVMEHFLDQMLTGKVAHRALEHKSL